MHQKCVCPPPSLPQNTQRRSTTSLVSGIVMSRRRCFCQCAGNLPLFSLPKEYKLRNTWLQFVFPTIPQQFNSNIYLCALHFMDDCFLNLSQYTAGFSKRLMLKDGAVPTLLVTSGHPGSQPVSVISRPQPSRRLHKHTVQPAAASTVDARLFVVLRYEWLEQPKKK